MINKKKVSMQSKEGMDQLKANIANMVIELATYKNITIRKSIEIITFVVE